MSQDNTEQVAQTGSTNPAEKGEANAAERMFTASEYEAGVKARLAKEQRKHQREIDELKSHSQKSSGNVEEDLRGKLTKYESENQTMVERLNKLKTENLRAIIEKKLAVDFAVVDPELIADRFLSRNLVRYDEDDAVFVDNARNDLDDLIKTELEKRPYLVKSMAKGGAGTKAPGAMTSPSNPDLSQMTSEEFAAFKQQKFGVVSQSSKKNWLTKH